MQLAHTNEFAPTDKSINCHEDFGSGLCFRFLNITDFVIGKHGPFVEDNPKNTSH